MHRSQAPCPGRRRVVRLSGSEPCLPLRRGEERGCGAMRTALIAAIVSAVVAAGSATAATILVTSKNIQNGTIQTVDISAKAKKALKGNRGPQGPAGQDGFDGAHWSAGTAGTARVRLGITQVTTVDGPAVAQCAASGGGCRIATSEAICPSGFRVVGGGHISLGTANIVLYSAITGHAVLRGDCRERGRPPQTQLGRQPTVWQVQGLTATSPESRLPNVKELGGL